MRSFNIWVAGWLVAFATGCVELDTVAKAVDDARTVAKIGFLANTEIEWPSSTKMLTKALKYYVAEGVDAIVVVGDPTKGRMKNQYEVFDAAVKDALKGSHVDFYLATNRMEMAVNGFEFVAQYENPMGLADKPTFYGAGKMALTDERCVYPVRAKCVNVGSMRGISLADGYFPLPRKDYLNSAQGALVKVYSDEMKVLRLDFGESAPPGKGKRGSDVSRGIYVEEVSEPWTIRLEGDDQVDERGIPRFWDDVRISVVRGYDKVGNALYTVRWPHLKKRNSGVRAGSYEVVVEAGGEKVAIQYFVSSGFYLAETRDDDSLACTIPESVLGENCGEKPARIGITPISGFGENGDTVWTTLP